ncbi:MAG: hypothetical protein LBJ25_03785 [Candidatus Margulisbacteria bacterium]|jgi:hypothetical protein|nr:hypothetical protein [Candidatus Margulisiibacteriota bacterium]
MAKAPSLDRANMVFLLTFPVENRPVDLQNFLHAVKMPYPEYFGKNIEYELFPTCGTAEFALSFQLLRQIIQ